MTPTTSLFIPVGVGGSIYTHWYTRSHPTSRGPFSGLQVVRPSRPPPTEEREGTSVYPTGNGITGRTLPLRRSFSFPPGVLPPPRFRDFQDPWTLVVLPSI